MAAKDLRLVPFFGGGGIYSVNEAVSRASTIDF